MSIEAAFPHHSSALVDAEGRLTRAGLRFLEALWLRTGGASGVPVELTTSDTTIMHTTAALENGAGVATATLTNAPVAGNPTKWIPVDDNGTTRYIPSW